MTSSPTQFPPSESVLQASHPTIEFVLHVIDFEVAKIESEQKRPGWTLWAVYGGIASSLWLFLDQWETGNVNIINVAHLFLVFSIFRDIVHYGRRQLSPVRHRHYEVSPRFNFPTTIESPSGMFFYCARFTLLFVLAILLASKVAWHQSAPTILFYGLFTLIATLGFGATYYKFLVVTRYVPKSRIANNRKIVFEWILILVALTWGAYGHLSYLLRFPDLISSPDVRVAGLFLVLSFLIPMAFEHVKHGAIISSLTEIRRDLVFGRLDAASALRKADIAILGLPIEDKLQEEIRNVLNLWDNLECEYRRILDQMQNVISQLPIQDAEIKEEHVRNAKAVLLKTMQDMKPLLSDNELKKLTRRLRIYSTMAREIAPEKATASREVLDKIDSVFAELTAKSIDLNKNLEPTLQRLVNAEKRLGSQTG